jgi:hypothetical protein
MMFHRERVLFLAAPLVASLALAAPAGATDSKSDKAILKAGVVTKADVPTTWTSRKAASTDRTFQGVPECKEIRDAVSTAKKKEPRAQSREFEDPANAGTTSADSIVYAFSNVNAATKFVAAYQSPAAPTCFEAGTRKVLSNTQAAGSPTVSPVTDLQGVGDDAVGYEIAVPFSSGGQTATLYLDFIFVRVGRAVVGFRFSNGDARIPEGPAIVQTVAQRVATAEA